MKSLFKSALLAGVVLSGVAFANDPIVGEWQMIEDGKPKAIVKISASGDVFDGVVTEGLTDKAKSYVNVKVIKGLKAQGGGKYGKGTITDPRDGKEYSMTATLTNDTLSIKGGYKVPLTNKVIGKKQVWERK